MVNELNNVRVAFLTANEGVEQAELVEPWNAVEAAGATAELVSLEAGKVQAFNHLDRGDVFAVDVTVADADADALRRLGPAGRRRQPGRAADGRRPP